MHEVDKFFGHGILSLARVKGLFLFTFGNVKIRYNSPLILTYTLVCIGVMILADFTSSASTQILFTNYPGLEFKSPLWYLRLVSHGLGHQNWSHLLGNFSLILLLGPILEEKYGSKKLLFLSLFTLFITGILNSLFFSTGLLGASGLVFLFIILSSFTNIKGREIPLTFILVALLYLTKEVMGAFQSDQVSQFAHIIGGICGGIFGFWKK